MSYDDLMKNYRSEGIRMRLIYLLSQFNFVCDKLKYEIKSNLSLREFVGLKDQLQYLFELGYGVCHANKILIAREYKSQMFLRKRLLEMRKNRDLMLLR